ncbi:SLAM family member 6-like [Elgaria multicarinata webbii]|uniref:SLAM family member 6-like n=1 Tax=Elgaria multicarinata webbii TaxID=159646 RepID=UPI002FCD683E
MPKPKLPIRSLWGTVICFFLGAVSNAVENPPHQMNGIRGQSASFLIQIPPTKVANEVEWNFQSKSGKTLLIAAWTDGQWERPNPSDRFGQRLEMAAENSLRIKGLEMEDSGVYKGYVTLHTGEIPEYMFNLTVYEPVPTPKILHYLNSSSSDGCNVTLRCEAPGKGEFNTSWKRGNLLRDLEESSDEFHLSNNGTSLALFWHLTLLEPNFTCLVSNPADHKSASVNLLGICPNRGESQARRLWIFAIIHVFFSPWLRVW